jgi:ergothioneine biosynthesis protein EgtB
MTISNVHSPAPASLRDRYADVRRQTEALAAPLETEDYVVSSMPDVSPTKWHLAHTSWFFETFLLSRALPGYRAFDPAFRALFNSYYVSIGTAWSRPARGLLTRPSLEEVRAFRAHVDAGVRALLERHALSDEHAFLLELGLHHEEQHQELMLTDLKHLLSRSPLYPVYVEATESTRRAAPPLRWHRYDPGLVEIGHAGLQFAFDNETPRHRVHLDGFQLASRPATNAEFLAFVEDRGYERAELWLSEGFDVARASGWRAPLHWIRRDGEWMEFTLSGLCALDPDLPVCHVSGFEADAFANWSGARLPTESEWEHAAETLPPTGHFADSRRFHPLAAPDHAGTPQQMFGDVWEWTSSDYAPYPGFRPWPGDVGEYNGKFMSNQRVLRGGSCATPRGHVRASYRNFFPLDARWQFSGVRLARDAR